MNTVDSSRRLDSQLVEDLEEADGRLDAVIPSLWFALPLDAVQF